MRIQLLKRFRARLKSKRPKPAILMYHRVAREVHDPWGLAVTPSDFEEQIAYLKKRRSAMSLKELIQALRNRTLPRDAIAVTFDDGYRDNLVNARPVLLRHQVPATLFVATGYTSRKKLFWRDELAAVTLASSTRVDSFRVRGLADIRFEWGDPERADISGSWRAWTEPVTARQRCYIAAWQRLRREKADDRDTAMAQLRQSLSIPPQDLAMLTEESELREISVGGVIHLGAHTVTHPSLPGIEKGERRKEIERAGRSASASLLTE